MHVSAVYAGARLAVIPPVFPLARLRALGRAQAVRVACRKLSTVNCRMVQIVVVAPGGESRAFDSNDSLQLRLVFGGDFQNDRTAHRASDDHRTSEFKRLPNRSNNGEVLTGLESILPKPPAVGRIRAAVIRHIERDDAISPGDRGIVEQVSILTAVGACRMKTQQRDAAAGLFEIETVFDTVNGDIEVASEDRLNIQHFLYSHTPGKHRRSARSRGLYARVQTQLKNSSGGI